MKSMGCKSATSFSIKLLLKIRMPCSNMFTQKLNWYRKWVVGINRWAICTSVVLPVNHMYVSGVTSESYVRQWCYQWIICTLVVLPVNHMYVSGVTSESYVRQWCDQWIICTSVVLPVNHIYVSGVTSESLLENKY